MKKHLISAAAVATLAGLSCFVVTAWGEPPANQGGTANRAAAAPANKIGLIDMAHIFKNYKKFEVLRQDLKAEIDQSDAKARDMVAQLKTIQDQMKEFKEGSPDFLAREKQLAEASSQFESFKKVQQREFLRKESNIYKTVYLEASDAVQQYAQYYGYTMIMRFNREGLDSADDPQTVIQRMNRQVVFFTPDDDITDKILGFLNRKYQESSGAAATPAAPATRNATNPAPAGRRQ